MPEVSKEFSIGILIPMVTTESDMVQVVEIFHRLASEMGTRDLPRIGAMIETPAAALSIPSLKKHVDFLSIGSNDLTQYTMAAGRENPLVTEYFIDDHPTILRLIELVVMESDDIPVSICGELAGRIDVIPQVAEKRDQVPQCVRRIGSGGKECNKEFEILIPLARAYGI
jgi:phosphoenolpyruvate-protein kinase (PTS system EI component)